MVLYFNWALLSRGEGKKIDLLILCSAAEQSPEMPGLCRPGQRVKTFPCQWLLQPGCAHDKRLQQSREVNGYPNLSWDEKGLGASARRLPDMQGITYFNPVCRDARED